METSLPEASVCGVHSRYTADSAEYEQKRERDHLPLKVLVELLTEAVDAGPVQLLVEGVRGSVCRRREGQCGLAKGSLPLSPCPSSRDWSVGGRVCG